MGMKITRATLTPYNEHGISSKSRSTNTDLKHAYLAQAAEMNFRQPDFHAHWWRHSSSPSPPTTVSPHLLLLLLLPFSPSPRTMSKLRTHLTIGELIRKRLQWGLTPPNFQHPIFHSSLGYTEHGRGTPTWAASEWRVETPGGRDPRALLPLIQASKGQKHIISPHI